MAPARAPASVTDAAEIVPFPAVTPETITVSPGLIRWRPTGTLLVILVAELSLTLTALPEVSLTTSVLPSTLATVPAEPPPKPPPKRAANDDPPALGAPPDRAPAAYPFAPVGSDETDARSLAVQLRESPGEQQRPLLRVLMGKASLLPWSAIHPSWLEDVIASCGTKIGVVDHVEGNAIKLTRSDSKDGQHHFIPASMVDHVDSHVHLNKNSEEACREWKSDAASCSSGG